VDVTLAPAHEQFIDEHVRSGRFLDGSEVVRSALTRMESQVRLAGARDQYAALTAGGGDGDIMAMAFIVMMEAAKSAREDLKAIMNQVKAINKAKAAMRELAGKIQRDAAANVGVSDARRLDFSRGLGSEQAYHAAPVPRLDPDAPGGIRFETVDLHPGRIERGADLQAVFEQARNDLDSMSEMGEMESLRLQMAMDRMSKMMSTLSNLLKKSSETAAEITQNIK